MVTDGLSLALQPQLSWSLLAPLLILAGLALATGAFLTRRVHPARDGVLLRLLAWSAAVAALLNPVLLQEQRDPIKDVAAIVVDQSPSQAIGRRAARTAQALTALKEKLAAFPDLETRIVTVGTDASTITETRLFDALSRALADVPRRRLAGVAMITDGQVHDVPSLAQTAADFGPIHALLSGDRNEADRRLTIVQAPSYGIVGKSATLAIRVEDRPGKMAEHASVTLRQEGVEPRVIRVPVGRDVHLEAPVSHSGPNVVELSVEPGAQELTLANNHAAAVINGVRDRLRVLLVSGEPHAGERTWRNLLKVDPAVDLVHFTILRPPEKQDGTPIRELSLIAFPIRELFEIKLEEFDLVIFDRYRQRGVLPAVYLDNLVRYVERGGALLDAGGPATGDAGSLSRTPLGVILPTEPVGMPVIGGFQPTVTALGRRHPVTADLPGDRRDNAPQWGRWFRQNDVTPLRGSVIMAGLQNRPLLVLDRVGQGRVAQLTSDHIWLWSRGFEGGGPQAELLRRLAHWLMKEPELEENDLRAHAEGNRVIVERRSLEDDSRSVTMTSPSEAVQTLTLTATMDGRAEAAATVGEPGLYRVTDGVRTALAIVGAINPPELADVRSTPERLAPAIEASGGSIHWLSDFEDSTLDVRRTRTGGAQAGTRWIGFKSNGDYVVTGVSDAPLLPVTLALLFALGGLIGAWKREGK
ncbi:GATase1_like domain-containing protein [Azospirillaceae bacterium]